MVLTGGDNVGSGEALMLVTVHREINPWDAHIVRALLESEGVPATVGFEHHISANWCASLALGGVRVQVPMSFLDQARTVLDDWRRSVLARALEAEWGLPAEVCPRCGADDWLAWRPMHFGSLLLLVLGFRFGIIFPWPRAVGRCCRQCACEAPWNAGTADGSAAPMQLKVL